MNTSGNDSLRSSKIENQSFSESINLKIAKRPANYYRLIQCDRNLLKDYKEVLLKIRTLYDFSSKYMVTMYVKNISREDLMITNEAEWNKYIDGGTILELIDSKNTLKIEYELSKPNGLDITMTEKAVEEGVGKLFENNVVTSEIMRSIFTQVIKSDHIKNKIKEDISLNCSQTENIKSYLNSKTFDTCLKRYLDKTLENLECINNIKGTFDDDKSTSDLLLFDNDEDEFMNVPSFIEFYNKSEVKDEFRSRVSQTFGIKDKI
jgi:hypothetical protein